MPQYDAGSAGIRIKPNFGGFVTEVETELRRHDFNLDIRVGADTAPAAAEIANLQRAARETQTFRMEADTRVAAAEIDNLQRVARESQAFRMGADTAVAAAEIANLQRIARENQTFRVDADTRTAAAELEGLRQAFRSGWTVNPQMSGNAASQAQSGMRRITNSLKSASIINISVGAVLGAGAAIAQLTQLAAALAKVGQSVAVAPAVGFAGLAGAAGLATGLSGIPAAFKAMSAESQNASESLAEERNHLYDVAEGQYQVEASNRGLTNAYKETSRAVRDVNADFEDQKLTVEGAALSVEEAGKRLNAVKFDPTADSTTRRRAQLDYDQALANQKRQQTSLQDLAQDSAEANAKGIEGSDQMISARHAQTQAVEGLRRATEALAKGSAAQAALDKALEKLSPQARKAVEDVRALGPAWTDVRKSAQDALTEGIGPSIKTLADQQLPNLRNGLSGINSAFNRGFQDVLTSLSSDKNKIDFGASLENTRVGFSNAMKAAGPFTDAVTKLTTVGTTFLPQFGEAIGNAADRFNDFIQQTSADGSLRAWMQDGITATRELFSILGNLGSAVASVFRASGAGETLASIDAITERWRAFLRSTEGQDRLKGYFDEAREAGAALRAVLEDVPGILRGVWEGFQTWAAIASPFLKLATSFLSAQPELVALAVAAFVGFKTLTPIFGGVKTGMDRTTTALGNVQSRATSTMSALRGIATATGGVANVAGVGATNLGRFGSMVQQAGTHVGAIARMQQSFMNASAGAGHFSRTTGAAAAAVTGLRSATSGISSALGGPWGIALAAVTIAAIGITREVRKASDQQDILASSSRALAISQREVTAALRGTAGAVSDTTMSKLAEQIDNVARDADRLAETAPGAFSVFTGAGRDIKGWFSGQAQAGTDAVRAQRAAADAGTALRDALKEAGLSAEEMASRVSGTDAEFNEFAAKLAATGNGGEEAIRKMRELRDEFVRNRDAARDTTPGFFKLNDAVQVLADTSKSGAERLNAMKDALDALSGKPIDAQQALAKYNDQVRATADLAANFDASEGVGSQLVKDDGTIDTLTANGRRLFDTLLGIKESTLEVAVAGGDLDARLATNAEQFATLARATGLSKDQIVQLAASVGLVPEQIRVLAKLEGADTTQAQLVAIGEMIKANNGKPITIPTELLTAEARAALDKWKVDVKAAVNNPNVTTIAANTDPARVAVDDFLKDPKTLVVNVELAKFKGLKVSGQVVDLTPERATGGRLPTSGPGTERRDGFLGVSRATGAPLSWLDGGEWIINRDSSEKYSAELAAINAGSFPRMAAGGVVGGDAPSSSIVESMRQIVAARFPGMTLTSGLRNTDNGYHSVGKAADFSNGSDSTPEMRALASFIATNFPQSLELIHQPFDRNIKNGSFVGDGLGVYGAGTMAEHRNHVHWAMATAPSASSATSVETSSVDGVSTPQSVINPQAALPGRRTDKELQRLTGEAAVDTANSERNAVYANPASTEQDRLAADLKYQQAQNSLESSRSSSDDEVPTLPGFLGKAGEILGMGILSGLGLEQSILSPSGRYAGAMKKGLDWFGKDKPNAGGYSYTPKNLPTVATPSIDASAATDPALTDLWTSEGASTGNVVVEAVKKAMAPAGWNVGSQWAALDQLVSHESSWNPFAKNPNSTATGLFQFLDQTWATVGGTKTFDPYLQGVYGQKYIAQRYGDPASAWDFWQKQNPHWYDQGGVASGRGFLAKNIIRPERTLSPHQTETYDSMLPLMESINAAAWSGNRIDTSTVLAPVGAAAGGGGHDFSVHIHEPRVADVNDLVDLAERRAHVRQVGMMAASPR